MLDIVRVPRGHKISIDDDGTVIAPNPTAGFDDRADDEVGKFLVQMKPVRWRPLAITDFATNSEPRQMEATNFFWSLIWRRKLE